MAELVEHIYADAIDADKFSAKRKTALILYFTVLVQKDRKGTQNSRNLKNTLKQPQITIRLSLNYRKNTKL
jgi:hypothetical protein